MGCGCSSHRGSRHFFTREEKVEMLKEHKEFLEKEVKGITEKIEMLQKQ